MTVAGCITMCLCWTIVTVVCVILIKKILKKL